MKIPKYLKGIISIILTVWISYWIIFAWVNWWLQSESWDTLTSIKWNELVSIAETNSWKLTWVSNSNWTLTATAFVGDGSALENLPAWSSTFAWSIKIGDDASACSASNAGSLRWTWGKFQACQGIEWIEFISINDWSTHANAGLSCKQLLETAWISASGVYWITANDTTPPFQVYCDMTTQGGWWTLVIRGYGGDSPAGWVNAIWAIGDYSNPSPSQTSTFKYSDNIINAIKSDSKYMIVSDGLYPNTIFFGNCLYDHDSIASAACYASYTDVDLTVVYENRPSYPTGRGPVAWGGAKATFTVNRSDAESWVVGDNSSHQCYGTVTNCNMRVWVR